MDKKTISVPQPNLVSAYNRYMSGVDRRDQKHRNLPDIYLHQEVLVVSLLP